MFCEKENHELLVTVITPTYNRAYTLERLYNSLKNQTCKLFEWIIVDDGSTDETRALVENFSREKAIEIRYFYKENGGKHTALNLAMKFVRTPLTIIVDSDDVLTSDAIETILKYHQKYHHLQDLCGFCFLRAYPSGKVIGDLFPKDEMISDFITMRLKEKIEGDKAEVFYSEILKKFEFPVFEGEKYLPENVVWFRMAFEYKVVFVNKVIYITEYLPDGLTANSKFIFMKNPQGFMALNSIFLDKRMPLLRRIRAAISFNTCRIIAKKSLLSSVRTLESGKLLVLLLAPFGWLNLLRKKMQMYLYFRSKREKRKKKH